MGVIGLTRPPERIYSKGGCPRGGGLRGDGALPCVRPESLTCTSDCSQLFSGRGQWTSVGVDDAISGEARNVRSGGALGLCPIGVLPWGVFLGKLKAWKR
jgi:hypothetical protein